MRRLKYVTLLIVILLGATTLLVPVTPNTAPPYPDMAPDADTR